MTCCCHQSISVDDLINKPSVIRCLRSFFNLHVIPMLRYAFSPGLWVMLDRKAAYADVIRDLWSWWFIVVSPVCYVRRAHQPVSLPKWQLFQLLLRCCQHINWTVLSHWDWECSKYECAALCPFWRIDVQVWFPFFSCTSSFLTRVLCLNKWEGVGSFARTTHSLMSLPLTDTSWTANSCFATKQDSRPCPDLDAGPDSCSVCVSSNLPTN